jgi:tRNA threonylcarbamoyladenosine biosynthesis protein TsaE
MDWYRLNGSAEAVQAGVEERIISGDRCWIEWPERAAELLPYDTWFITLRAEDADTRQISTSNQSFS